MTDYASSLHSIHTHTLVLVTIFLPLYSQGHSFDKQLQLAMNYLFQSLMLRLSSIRCSMQEMMIMLIVKECL